MQKIRFAETFSLFNCKLTINKIIEKHNVPLSIHQFPDEVNGPYPNDVPAYQANGAKTNRTYAAYRSDDFTIPNRRSLPILRSADLSLKRGISARNKPKVCVGIEKNNDLDLKKRRSKKSESSRIAPEEGNFSAYNDARLPSNSAK